MADQGIIFSAPMVARAARRAEDAEWDDNPWIVAVSFDVERRNIDQVPA